MSSSSSKFEIQSTNLEKASGALPKRIPNSALPVYVEDVEAVLEQGGSVQYIVVSTIPSPLHQGNILQVTMSGTFDQMAVDNIVRLTFPSSSSAFVLSSTTLTGYFTFQTLAESLNLPYYWSVVSWSLDEIVLLFEKKDLLVNTNEPYVFSITVNFF